MIPKSVQASSPLPALSAQRLLGKTALVTGFGSGIGRGCALMLAHQGARVIGCDIDSEGAEVTLQTASAAGLRMEGSHPCDLTDPGAVDGLFTTVAERFDALDILVNAAATAVFAPIEQLTYEDWRRTLAGELDTVFLACKAAWPLLKVRGGSIVNFASVNAYLVLEGSAALAHCAGKGGVLAMSRQLALEGAPHGIRCNTVSPGMIVTGATEPVLAQPGFEANVLSKALIKRLGQPEDIAWCVTFLASDESTWLTAADIPVDGGACAL